MTTLMLGKTPARADDRDLMMARYTSDLPPIPDGPLGHDDLITATGWGMLGNDSVGDCVLAGAAHETMLWNREQGRTIAFSDTSVLGDYSAITGYIPGQSSTDRGTDMRDAMNYRRATGVADASGARHQIAAYIALRAGNLDEIKQAIHLFSAASVGIQVPSTAMDQFNQNQPWDVVAGSSVEGGHYVPITGYDAALDMFHAITWGRVQLVTPRFLAAYADEGFAALTNEALSATGSVDGFSLDQLTADLSAL